MSSCPECGVPTPVDGELCVDCRVSDRSTLGLGALRETRAPARNLAGGPSVSAAHPSAPAGPTGTAGTAAEVIDGRYVKTGSLGRGGMGEVIRVFDLQLELDFALKVLRPELSGPAARDILRREVATAMQVSHPNLLRVHSLSLDATPPYLVMEYVDGGDLYERFVAQGRRLDEDEAVSLCAKVLDALEALHAARLVHLDVKPQNILLSRLGEPKLADYGISKGLKEQIATERTGSEAVGTVLYMAPEQLQGRLCDRRADIYSVGVMLHLLVTGDYPFRTESRQEVETWHIRGDRSLPRLDEGLGDIVRRCVAPAADDRFATAREVAAALREGADTVRLQDPISSAAADARRAEEEAALRAEEEAARAAEEAEGQAARAAEWRAQQQAQEAEAEERRRQAEELWRAQEAQREAAREETTRAEAARLEAVRVEAARVDAARAKAASVEGSSSPSAISRPAGEESPPARSALPLIIGAALGVGALVLVAVVVVVAVVLGGDSEPDRRSARSDPGVSSTSSSVTSSSPSATPAPPSYTPAPVVHSLPPSPPPVSVDSVVTAARTGTWVASADARSASCDTLWIARNWVYARHGYAFQTAKAKQYFGGQASYRRNASVTSGTVAQYLSASDRANRDLLVRVERERGCR